MAKAVRVKILYGENYTKCKVHSIDKETLTYMSFDNFKKIIMKAVGFSSVGQRIQYRDDEGTFVTMKDNLDLNDAILSLSPIPNTDGDVSRMCVRINDELTPVGKREPIKEKEQTESQPKEDSKERKRRLDFNSASSSNSKRPVIVNVPTHEKVSTPIERYITKTEENIREKDKQINELLAKESWIISRLQTARLGNGQGSLCHNCHMRLGHTARNCNFDKCSSVYSCGEEKFHSGEVSLRELKQRINKLKNEKDKLLEELKHKKSSAESIKDSILNRLENSLLDADRESYYVHGTKNWSLLRKHVFVLRNYCRTVLKGKIPPRHEVLNTLKTALSMTDTDNGTNVSGLIQHKMSKASRENHCKPVLERRGIEFPTESSPTCLVDENWRPSNWIDRIKPKTQDEENEQLKLALSASFVESHRLNQLPQSQVTCTSTCPRNEHKSSVPDDSTDQVNEAASALLSLRKH